MGAPGRDAADVGAADMGTQAMTKDIAMTIARRSGLLVAFVFLLASHAFAAGTATIACEVSSQASGATAVTQTCTVTLTSTAGGAVSGNAFTTDFVRGKVRQVKVVPDAGGTQPTDLFDLTILDADGADILGGDGANLSNGAAVYLLSDPPVWLTSSTSLDFVLANAGSAKVVTVKVVIER